MLKGTFPVAELLTLSFHRVRHGIHSVHEQVSIRDSRNLRSQTLTNFEGFVHTATFVYQQARWLGNLTTVLDLLVGNLFQLGGGSRSQLGGCYGYPRFIARDAIAFLGFLKLFIDQGLDLRGIHCPSRLQRLGIINHLLGRVDRLKKMILSL